MYIRLFKEEKLILSYISKAIPRIGETVRLMHEEYSYKVLSVEHVVSEGVVDCIDCNIE